MFYWLFDSWNFFFSKKQKEPFVVVKKEDEKIRQLKAKRDKEPYKWGVFPKF